LNEEQYRSLCEACDRVLLAPDSTIERVAIPWLHVIREHPVFLDNYVDLFEPTKGGKAIVRKWWRLFRRKAGWFRQLLRSLHINGKPWFGPDDLPSEIDVLFVSHLLNASQAGREDDFYFGGLPNEVVDRGHSAVIALINHSGQNAEHLAGKWNGSSLPRVILSGSLRFSEEATLRRRLKKESLRLKKLAKRETAGLFRKVLVRAYQEALSGGSLTTLRMATQIGTLAAKLQPKAIVVTHEGHAWERVAFAAARSVDPNVKCIGYQHAALFRLQHAIRRNLAREYNPDHILTAGTISKAQLERAPGLNGIPITVLGSNRTFKGIEAIRQLTTQANRAKLFDNPACLVLPEGIASECYLLFEFSLGCAQSCPEIKFIWRLHPIVTYESLAAKNPKLRNVPKNIVLSQATLEEDMAQCCWTLYRGTTAVIQAVVAGLQPIYLQLPEELTIDPLYELKGWRTSVKTIADFIRVIRYDQDRLLIDSESEFRFAEGYCRDFFKSLNSGALEAAIISKGKA
jgi:hypothetical protein